MPKYGPGPGMHDGDACAPAVPSTEDMRTRESAMQAVPTNPIRPRSTLRLPLGLGQWRTIPRKMAEAPEPRVYHVIWVGAELKRTCLIKDWMATEVRMCVDPPNRYLLRNSSKPIPRQSSEERPSREQHCYFLKSLWLNKVLIH